MIIRNAPLIHPCEHLVAMGNTVHNANMTLDNVQPDCGHGLVHTSGKRVRFDYHILHVDKYIPSGPACAIRLDCRYKTNSPMHPTGRHHPWPCQGLRVDDIALIPVPGEPAVDSYVGLTC